MPTSTSPVVPAPAGDKTVMVRMPVELATWASAQARHENSDLSKKIRSLLNEWRANVEKAERAAQAAAEAQRKSEIQAAISAALRKKGRTPKAKGSPQKK